MAKLSFNAVEWESQRAAECLAEGDSYWATDILNDETPIGLPLRRMLADMLGSGSNIGTGFAVVRRNGRGAISKDRTHFWRDTSLGEQTHDLACLKGMSLGQARAEVAIKNRLSESTVRNAHQEYQRYMKSIES